MTVFFEEPFWAGVFVRVENGKLSACKVTFGAEPRGNEVWEFVFEKLRPSPLQPVRRRRRPGKFDAAVGCQRKAAHHRTAAALNQSAQHLHSPQSPSISLSISTFLIMLHSPGKRKDKRKSDSPFHIISVWNSAA
ncbi:MAG: DUF2992 family protein [Oscillospiraceae bacterium]|nr:DUF2992 family protein [Oscillospiraceae bacterium]